ncbi:hypothetical protein NKR19_g9007 [Coniochaeta hoffmannii]|uniref:Uncharacterized protein n=1 Tax=Coniochaeta hoffmannii TaxID=91930 RepID=A0AA38RLS2_9PEZI|nr:hypothetical protein NKR19_g9007 [Coniochaeta hoffmannii]
MSDGSLFFTTNVALEPLRGTSQSLLPEELATSFTGTNAIFPPGISKCVARDDSVQINGHVAGTIQYIINLHLHQHVTQSPDQRVVVLEDGDDAMKTPKIRPPMKDIVTSYSQPSRKHGGDSHTPRPRPSTRISRQNVVLHSNPRPGTNVPQPQTVLATIDPSSEGNWIAARIVTRLELEYEHDKEREKVPPFDGEALDPTRRYVDLACHGSGTTPTRRRCKHRFYVVNHLPPDILFGSELCSSRRP